MTRQSKYLLLFILLPVLAACKGTGFRHMEGASEKATVQSANETLQQIEVALERYHEINHRYPQATELSIYDSLRDFFLISVDAANLYRNENDQATYIAVGGRKNKIVYHYPATLGSGEYTLYWIGLNAVDEEGRGDDIFATPTSTQKQLSRHVFVNFRDDSAKVEFVLSSTGADMRKDEALFVVRSGKTVLYEDRWQLSGYTRNRPDLNERERQEMLNAEFDRFLRPAHFYPADSLAKNPGSLLTRRIDSRDFSSLSKAKLPIFTYYSAAEGSKAVYWSVKGKRVTVIELSN
jgi:hypothetical protein